MKKKEKVPACVFCGKSIGVEFRIFNPKFKPFGTACAPCEDANDTLPA